jgi:circadian clock protein KaiC
MVKKAKVIKKFPGSKIDRMPTGIPGFDKLVEGGFVPSSAVLINGGPGVGKSIFCYQYIYEGLKNGEACMYVSFEESPEKIRNEAGDFGWDFAKYEKEGKLAIVHIDPTKLAEIDISKYRDVTSTIIKDIQARAIRMKAKRIAIDPISVFGLFLEGKSQIRRRTYEMVQKLAETGATILLTCEHHESEHAGAYGVESYVADGNLMLRAVSAGRVANRTLEVVKMRRTKINEGIHSVEITSNGMKVSD